MTEKNTPSMDSYRFGRGEEPSDDMLAQIMKEAREEAVTRQQKATKDYFETLRAGRPPLSSELKKRIERLCND